MDETLESYEAGGAYVRVPEGRLFVTTVNPDAPGTPLLVLHGFPTCAHDFFAVAPILAARRPLLLFDFLGYGMSDKPASYGYSLFEQADCAVQLLLARGVREVDVLAHDMGTSVLCELLARRARGLLPVALRSIVFSNGSVFVDMASLTLGQRVLLSPLGGAFAKLSSRRSFEVQLARVFAQKPSPALLRTMSALAAKSDGFARFPQLIRYVTERRRFAARWHGALTTWEKPALVAWGALDPVAVLPIGEKVAQTLPRGELVRFPTLGHYPQLEAPEAFGSVVAGFFDRA